MNCPIHHLLSIPQPDTPRLVWLPEDGVGFFDCDTHNAKVSGASPYDAEYFARYAERMNDPIGARLMAHRAHLVTSYGGSAFPIIDVGIGSGAFVEEMSKQTLNGVWGFDVNPAGIEWLKGRGQWGDLYKVEPGVWEVATFWDSLEHIRDPRQALAQVGHMAFVAIPIFRDVDHLLASRHYRKDEHFWYFTRAGFRAFAEREGFQVMDILATETAIGRDDIETFVLRRHV